MKAISEIFSLFFCSHSAYSSHYTSPPSFKFTPVISSPVGGANIPYGATSTPFGVNEPGIFQKVHIISMIDYFIWVGIHPIHPLLALLLPNTVRELQIVPNVMFE